MSATKPQRTPRPLIKKCVGRKTADDAVREMGGSVSPLARKALDALYGTEIDKQLDDLTDDFNEIIKTSNRQWQQLDKMGEELAELKEHNDRQIATLKQVEEDYKRMNEDLKREEALYRFFDALEEYDSWK